MYYQPQINMTPDEILCYLRKSRSDDPVLSVNEVLAKHEEILDDWSERHLGSAIPERNKYREVVSGETLKERPEIQIVLRRIESPGIKAIMCVEPQRLTRGDLEDVGKLMKLLKYTNTLIVTPQRIYDLHDDYDWDAFERELKRGNDYLEYTKKILSRGRYLSVSQGHYIGSVPPHGFDKIQVVEGKTKYPSLAENKEQADAIRMMFDLYVNRDMGYKKVANTLDDYGFPPPKGEHWSPAAIKDMLQNVHYIGKVKWNWRKNVPIVENGEVIKTRPKSSDYSIFEGKHNGIVSEELFRAAQEKQGRNHRAKAFTVIRNPFASLLFCKCGRAMAYRTNKNSDGTEKNAPRLVCDGQSHCGTGSCTYDEIIERICDILKQCITDFEIELEANDISYIKAHEKLIKNLEKKLKEIEARELAQWESQAHPDPAQRMPAAVFKTLNEKLLKEKVEIQKALTNAYETMPQPIVYEEKIKRFQNALDALKNPDVNAATKNQLLKQCIERIDYSREKPQRITGSSNRIYIDGKRRKNNGLKTGGNWTSPPIILDVKLKI